jgi:hypothetical protein
MTMAYGVAFLVALTIVYMLWYRRREQTVAA